MGFYDAIRIGAGGASSASDYTVDRSLRFNSSDGAKLSRANSSDGDRNKWTFSFWIKYAEIASTSNNTRILAKTGTGSNRETIHVYDGTLTYQLRIGNSVKALMRTDLTDGQIFTDTSAWSHIVVIIDTANNTTADRVIFYKNGVRLDQTVTTNMSQNSNTYINSTDTIYIGNDAAGVDSNMYLAETHFLDGYAYDPSYFGETNTTTGQWVPKGYSGNYGSQGWYLKFDDNSNTTATTLGKDSSGNDNNWTPANFSVSAGEGNDSLADTPTNNFCVLNPLEKTSGTISNGNLNFALNAGYGVRGSFFVSTGKWYFEAAITGGTNQPSYSIIGIQRITGSLGSYGGTNQIPDGYGLQLYPYRYAGSTGSAYDVGSISLNDVIGVAFDLDAGNVYFYKNGTLLGDGSAAFSSITAGEYAPYVSNITTSNNNQTGYANFGQKPFSTSDGEPPSGYKALNSANLPDPTILLPNKHFETLIYEGNNTDGHAITGLIFKPDWIWIKNRESSVAHYIVDSLRKSGSDYQYLSSNTTTAEGDASARFTSIDSGSGTNNGFTLPSGGTFTNANNKDYVAWNWNAGDSDGKTYTVTVVDDSGNKYRFDGFAANAVTLDLAEGGTYIFNYPSAHPFKFSTTADGTHGGGSEYTTGVTHNSSTQVTIVVAASAPQLYYYCGSHSGMGGAVNTNSTLGSSNFDGNIQTIVKANTTAGFSIMTYTGTGSAGTCGHGLGAVPDTIITKRRDGSGEWTIYNKNLDNASSTSHRVQRFKAIAQTGSSAAYYGNDPTNLVQHQAAYTDLNGNNETYVAYCFTGVENYSRFGRYEGNGNVNGPFVFTGFSIAFLMVKNIDSTVSWVIYDNKRSPYNETDEIVYPDATNAETNANDLDFLANGFKLRTTGNKANANAKSYIYFAFAESPFKYARAR